MPEYIADLHLHSRYARACSQNISVEGLDSTAKEKGIKIISTGDFTHPLWINELKDKLEEAEPGFYTAKGSKNGTRFVLGTEVSNIFDAGGKNRKVHSCILVPSIEDAEAINEAIKKKGSLASDGRPTLMMSCSELVEKAYSASKDAIVFPAHCLLPTEMVIANPEIKEIQYVKEGDRVFTHTGSVQKVQRVLSRAYAGSVLKVTPWYFSTGVETTPEHPFFGIKTIKNCSWGGSPCRPTVAHIRNCYFQHYKNYKPSWIMAKDLEIGDVLIYPRITKEEDVAYIKVSAYAKIIGEFPGEIPIEADFCKLVGYYLAEGYTNNRDGIGFSFNKDKEVAYVKEVSSLVSRIFGVEGKKGKTNGDIIFYSKTLMWLFSSLFYDKLGKRAENKSVPQWMLYIQREKQAALFKAWWIGDKGYTISRLLHNQMKMICLRLGIIPSVGIDTTEKHAKRGKHFIGARKVVSKHDIYIFPNLAIFEDKYGFLEDKAFRNVMRKTDRRHGWIDENCIYIPIRAISKRNYIGPVFNLEVEQDNSYLTEAASVHNCWTPWFGVLGSFSGFDSIEDAYEDQAKHIYCYETGLSADPPMCWRLSKLDRYLPISNSDAHSLAKMGREVTVFEFEEKDLSYQKMFEAIKNKKLKANIEFYPEEGKYHYDGHRNCQVSLSPTEAQKYNGRCPKCGRPLTIGVLHRVNQLADREEGYKPENAIPTIHAVPLLEMLAQVKKTAVTSMSVKKAYRELLGQFGTEFNILLKDDTTQIAGTDQVLATAIENVRNDKVKITPGYDGVFGIVDVLGEQQPEKQKPRQKSMSDFG